MKFNNSGITWFCKGKYISKVVPNILFSLYTIFKAIIIMGSCYCLKCKSLPFSIAKGREKKLLFAVIS